MLNLVSFSQNKPVASPSLHDVSRLFLRIELLRFMGKSDEANRLEAEELHPLIASFPADSDPDMLTNEKLQAIQQVEHDRVANADVLAQLLAPLLAERLVPLLAPKLAAPSVNPGSNSRSEKIPPNLSVTPISRGPKSIADLIDGMLGQERTAASSRSP